MKRFALDSRGFTLAEMIIACLFGMIVMATLYSFYREQLFYLISQENKTATMEDARGALDLMVREMINAGSWTQSPYTAPAGCARIASASSTSIRIQADLNADGLCLGTNLGDDVMYSLSSSSITRSVNGGVINSAVIDNVAIPSGSSFLTYYKSDNTSFTPSSAADRDLVKRVTVIFAVQVDDPTPWGKAAGKKISSTLTSSLEFRNY